MLTDVDELRGGEPVICGSSWRPPWVFFLLPAASGGLQRVMDTAPGVPQKYHAVLAASVVPSSPASNRDHLPRVSFERLDLESGVKPWRPKRREKKEEKNAVIDKSP